MYKNNNLQNLKTKTIFQVAGVMCANFQIRCFLLGSSMYVCLSSEEKKVILNAWFC